MDVVRIANCSGFYGDRRAAAREMVEGGPIDYLTGDYLAELTMALLWRTRERRPDGGYARTFLAQMEEVLGTCLDRGIRVVSNAGGLDPVGLAGALGELGGRLGLRPRVAAVGGDDLVDRLPDLDVRSSADGTPFAATGLSTLTAHAYLGGWGIVSALEEGADVVVTGRVTDAALVVAPAAHHFGWDRSAWNRLAGALVAGHVLECGAQATGGNYSFFREVPGLDHVGFPLVEMRSDGSFVVTKHPDTGGLVSEETVTAQLLYEIGGHRYASPDVVARFDTIDLGADGPDRVVVSGVDGEPPPPTLKAAVNYRGGFVNRVTFVLTGLDIDEKARAVEEALWPAVGGRDTFAHTDVRLSRRVAADPASDGQAEAELRVTVQDPDAGKVGRAFSGAAVEMALSHYPGFYLTSPPTDASPYAGFWSGTVPAADVPSVVTMEGRRWEVSSVAPTSRELDGPGTRPGPSFPDHKTFFGEKVRAPLGSVVGARSGDKGGDANLGIWTRSPGAYPWLASTLTVERLRDLVPETRGLEVVRHEFPNLYALNFEIRGLLGEGAAASTRPDPQAKSLGESLRARLVDVPVSIAPGADRPDR